MSTTMTSKGQVTVPKAVRDHLGLRSGSKVNFRHQPDGSVTIERLDGQSPQSRFRQFVGHAGAGLSTEQIMRLTRGED
jgi:AbrB family looped-hinge helix DNA binding protein